MSKPTSQFYKDFWQQRRAKRASVAAVGCAYIEWHRGRVHVSSPINPRFIAGAKELGGYWRSKTSLWTFPAEVYDDVVALCREVYGPNKCVTPQRGAPEKESPE